MRKSVKRILCGVMALFMSSSLAVEYGLRSTAESIQNTASANGITFENVTGQYDTSKLKESFYNDSVLSANTSTPTYENRTIIVTLSKAPIADRAGEKSVGDFVQSWSGERALEEIASEQDAFLRKLKKTDISYTLERRYDTLINGVAIETNTKYVSAIKKMAGVENVVIATSYSEPETITTQATSVVENKTNVYETGIYDAGEYADIYGAGSVVAVLDTGLDYTHEAFQGFKNRNVDVAWDEAYIKDKLDKFTLTAETKSGSLTAGEVYISEKVPFAYDYADNDPDVYPSYSNHGTHVAGIIGGYNAGGYADKEGNPITDKAFHGVVPDAQLAIFKVFTDDLDDPDLGGAEAEDIIAALEDCVTLGVDVINMSLGTSCGFTTTNDGDDEGELLNKVYNSIQERGITLVCAASNDYSSGYGGVFGTNLKTNPDSSTVGSPSTFAASLSVASINGQKVNYMVANEDSDEHKTFVFYEESRDIDSNPYDFMQEVLGNEDGGTFEYVVVPGVGQRADYTSAIKKLFKEKDRIALVKRGDISFEDKVKIAKDMGACGVIVYNNVAGVIRMNLGEIEDAKRAPAISITLNAGNALVKGAKSRIGTITLNKTNKAGPFMSEFSSWGPTHDLKIKPEITAHGGEITSAVPGGYGEQSGTSMATPNMAGFMAIVRNYIKTQLTDQVTTESGEISNVLVNRLAMQLTMSTAGIVYDQDNLPYSPRKQGAGVAKVENVVNGTSAYLFTDVAENDYRPKIELGDDPDKKGVYTLTYKIKNFGSTALTFTTDHKMMTETLASDGLAVSEQAYMLDDNGAIWSVDGKEVSGDIVVGAGEVKEIKVKLSLSSKEKSYIEKSFPNGMYVEGFLSLVSKTEGQSDLNIPFLGFYGDWKAAPMLDYSAFEVAESEQDASIEEEDKIQASVWATLPYASYYNEKYIIPMGGYVYLLDENDEKMYVDEDHCAVSRYNEYYGEGNAENYMTTTGIKALYAGLLRNARIVKYKIYSVETGELIYEDECKRVGKAYTGGGSAVPANVEMEFSPELHGLSANGKYKVDYEFYMEEEDTLKEVSEENTFSFSFTVDYEAPILEKASIRYYNYKDGNKQKQRIYLDIDVYDNHYAQAIMLCYPKLNAEGETVLQIATDYPTPVRNANKNGTTTVSIEITDIYQHAISEYGSQLYLQMEDYALNSCMYRIHLGEANAEILPENGGFTLASGEEAITLGVYETHKVSLVYGANYSDKTDLSNFLWTSKNPGIAEVRNGEIVGLSEGSTEILVSDRKGGLKRIQVTVDAGRTQKLATLPDSISFDVIKNDLDALVKAEGMVSVKAGKEFTLNTLIEPWYHPMTGLKVKWQSSNESVATVDQNGNVKTLKKGTTYITATIYKVLEGGVEEETLRTSSVGLKVVNEFTVSNYSLNYYNGLGYNEIIDGKEYLRIPTDMNIWYIGEEAFKDNDNIKRIIIPESVMDIHARAFMNCKALEEVYFVSEKAQKIPTAKLKLIYEQAFVGCTNLKKLDFSNTKTFTVAADCFNGCSNLSEIIALDRLSTMHHRAFKDCTSLTSLDLSGLHMSGDNVFEGCTSLKEIKTGKFTAIGNYMFQGCVGLKNTITLYTPKIGEGAFANCVNLQGVTLRSPSGEKLRFDIGAKAFENCGSKAGKFTFDCGSEIVRTIGTRAFANSNLSGTFVFNDLESLGANAFSGTFVQKITLNNTDLETVRISGIPFDGVTVSVGTSSKYTEANGVIYNKAKTKVVFVNQSVTSLTLPSTVEEIGAYAFSASKITKLVLPEGLKVIGESAFENAQIREIDFSKTALTEISDKAFYGAKVTNIILPDSVEKIGAYAFANSSLSAFTANGLKEIGDSAFESCIALETIALTDGISVMGSYVFRDCTALKEVTLPSVEKLGSFTFLGAKKLEKVTFGKNASATGDYTFAETPVKEVVFGDKVTKLGEGVLYNCKNITAISLPNGIVEVEAYALYNARALTEAKGLEKVEILGDYAFYNTKLSALNLQNAKTIGMYAFAIENAKSEGYTTLSIPKVETIGSFAFMGGKEASVELPASVQEIEMGAFARSENLVAISVNSANKNFFDEQGVLYRYINKALGEYELVAFPAASKAVATGAKSAGTLAKKSYEIKEGTLVVKAYSFYGLNKDLLNIVVLPYSVNLIGDAAFLSSGITEYEFESIQAPVLEVAYRQEIADNIKDLATEATTAYYKGYYYANFGEYIVDYTQFGDKTSSLLMRYPTNGKGYDNHIYSLYFGEKTKSGVLMDDATRACIEAIESLPTASEIKAWAKWDKNADNKAKVVAMAQQVKEARLALNNVNKDQAQSAFVSSTLSNKLSDVEKQLRSVKQAFGIESKIVELKVATTSKHKEIYAIGETFNKKGLVLTIVYDDYSTDTVKDNKINLLSQEPLTDLDRYVTVSYADIELRIMVTVDDELAKNAPKSGFTWVDGLIIALVVIVLVGGAFAYLLIQKRKTGEALVVIAKRTAIEIWTKAKALYKKLAEKVKELLKKLKKSDKGNSDK